MTKSSKTKSQPTQANDISNAIANLLDTAFPVFENDDTLSYPRDKFLRDLIWKFDNQRTWYAGQVQAKTEEYDNALFTQRVVQEAARSEGREIAGNIYVSDVEFKLRALEQRQAGLDVYTALLDAAQALLTE